MDAANTAKKSGNKTAEGEAHSKNGKSCQSSGNYVEAIEHHEKHLDIAKDVGDKAGIGQAYGNLGDCHRSLGQFDKAIEYYTMLLKILKQVGDKKGEGQACGKLADCFSFLGKNIKALEYRKLHRDFAKEGEDKAYQEEACSNLGDCYRSIGRYEKALDQHQICLDIAKEVADKSMEGKVYGKFGDCYNSMEIYDKALKYKEKQLSILRETDDKASEGKIYGDMGEAWLGLGQHDKAIEHHQMYLDISKQLEDKEGEGQALGNYGRVYLKMKDYDKAAQFCRESLECFEKFFEAVPGSFKSPTRDTFIKTNKLLKECLLLHDKREEALVAAERGRLRALADQIPNSYPIHGAEVTVAPLIDLTGIHEVVKALDSTVLFFSMTGLTINTWVLQPDGDIAFRKADVKPPPRQYPMQRLFDHPYGELGALISNARDLLRTGRVTKIEDRSLQCIYGPEDEQPIRRPNPMFPFAMMPPFQPARPAMFGDVPCMPVRRVPPPPPKPKRIDPYELSKLQELYKILLEPVRGLVKGSRLVVVPDDALPLVPFGALADKEGHYIEESLHVRVLPSLATAKMIMERKPEPEDPSARPLIVGDPDVTNFADKEDPVETSRLSEVNTQAKAVADLLKVQALTGRKANKVTVLKRLENASLIHIAAYGDMGNGAIFLAAGRKVPKDKVGKKDVTLTISEIERKRLRAKLVVLSIRHGGRGEIEAKGVIGIARAFLGAGARAVVMNLWSHKNEATTQFMKTFYENLVAGEKTSEALDKTMKSMKASLDFWHPYQWASYTLIGEDVTPFPKE